MTEAEIISFYTRTVELSVDCPLFVVSINCSKANGMPFEALYKDKRYYFNNVIELYWFTKGFLTSYQILKDTQNNE